MKSPVMIALPHPEWPRAFALERARLEEAFASTNAVIEHIGRTSGPGLAAKLG